MLELQKKFELQKRDSKYQKETIEKIKSSIADVYGWQKIPPKVQEEILSKDSYKCRICGSTNNLEVDYIKLPISGGKNNSKNLQTICLECNYSRYKNLNI